MGKRKPIGDRFEHLIDRVLDRDKVVCSISQGVFNEFGEHTIFKLIALQYIQEAYCKILKSNIWKIGKEGCIYIDLLAGSGCTKLKGRDLYVVGSPLMAITNSINSGNILSEVMCVELESIKASALENRMLTLYPNQAIRIYNKKAEEALPEIIDNIRKTNRHFLAFADYQGIKEISYRSLQQLLKERGDVIITCQISAIRREIPNALKDSVHAKVMDEFWGDDTWRKLDRDDEMIISAYQSKLEEYDRICRSVDIESETSGFSYALFYTAPETFKKSPFMRVVDDLNKLFQEKKKHPTLVKDILDIREGKKSRLTQFQTDEPC